MLEQAGTDCRSLDGRTGDDAGVAMCTSLSRTAQVKGSSGSTACCAPLEKPECFIECGSKSSSIETANFIVSCAEARGGLDGT